MMLKATANVRQLSLPKMESARSSDVASTIGSNVWNVLLPSNMINSQEFAQFLTARSTPGQAATTARKGGWSTMENASKETPIV